MYVGPFVLIKIYVFDKYTFNNINFNAYLYMLLDLITMFQLHILIWS